VDRKPGIRARGTELGSVRTRGGTAAAAQGDRYVRRGEVDLFAAFDTLKGTLTARVTWRKRRVEFLEFMEVAAERYPGQEIHIILGNLSTHKNCDDFLDKNPRIHFRLTPTDASRLNQVESWYSRFERQGLKGVGFKSRGALIRRNVTYVKPYDTVPKTISWKKKAAYGTKGRNKVRNQRNRAPASRLATSPPPPASRPVTSRPASARPHALARPVPPPPRATRLSPSIPASPQSHPS
jgi:hypothetical protein